MRVVKYNDGFIIKQGYFRWTKFVGPSGIVYEESSSRVFPTKGSALAFIASGSALPLLRRERRRSFYSYFMSSPTICSYGNEFVISSKFLGIYTLYYRLYGNYEWVSYLYSTCSSNMESIVKDRLLEVYRDFGISDKDINDILYNLNLVNNKQNLPRIKYGSVY